MATYKNYGMSVYEYTTGNPIRCLRTTKARAEQSLTLARDLCILLCSSNQTLFRPLHCFECPPFGRKKERVSYVNLRFQKGYSILWFFSQFFLAWQRSECCTVQCCAPPYWVLSWNHHFARSYYFSSRTNQKLFDRAVNLYQMVHDPSVASTLIPP